VKIAFLMFFFLSSSVCGSMSAVAQDFPSFRGKAENAIKAKNPGLNLIRKEEKDKEVVYLWGPTKADIVLGIFYGASDQEATEKMKTSISHISVGPDKKLTGIGDEAYLWKSYGRSTGIIRFRKSNVYIDLVAPSVAMAEDLARSLADLIPGK